MDNIKLPNFLVVGAPKSGTTSLYYYLKEHPEIFMSELKEPHFFSKECKKLPFKGPKDETLGSTKYMNLTWEDYRNLFKEATAYKAVGEASADYLYYFKCSIKNIKKYLGNPKIVIILRNPIERAYSAYLHMVRDGREYLSFKEALLVEEERKKENWDFMWFYKDVGFYYNQVKAYLKNFSEVKVYLYDDLKKDPLSLVQDIYRFLGVDDTFVPTSIKEKFNVSGIPKNKLLHNFLIKPNPLKLAIKPFVKLIIPKETRQKLCNKLLQKNLEKPQMKPETREYLKRLYREDILKLQDLIDKDLSHWLE